MNSEIYLRNRVSIKISKAFLWAVLTFGFMHFAYVALIYSGLEDHFALRLTSLFYLDSENNIPAWFSACILWSCSMFLFAISALETDKSINKYWFIIGLSLLYVSLDESISLHERASHKINGFIAANDIVLSDFFAFPWIVPASILVVIFGVALIPFFARLQNQVRQLFLTSAIVYLSGSVGFEMVGGFLLANSGRLPYLIAVAFEEILEMLGALILLHLVICEFLHKFRQSIQTAA